MNLEQSEINDLFREDEIQHDAVVLKLVSKDPWSQDGKYQNADFIFTDGVKFWRSTVSRSGSPFTEWNWESDGDADIDEVVKTQVLVDRWVKV